MDTSVSHRKHGKDRRSRGFTLLEVMGAIFVLAFGLLALAGLMAQMSGSTSQSRYMELASMLASEKLEDLNRVPNTDPSMMSNAGSLVTPTSATYVVNGTSDVVSYYDQVQISTGNGAAVELIQGSSGGTAGYWTITHTPGGQASAVFAAGSSSQTPSADQLVFQRLWTIELNPTVGSQTSALNGVRRVTVLVNLISPVKVGGGNVSYQATMVRP